jgi:predicted O-methyltransferase YrrM
MDLSSFSSQLDIQHFERNVVGAYQHCLSISLQEKCDGVLNGLLEVFAQHVDAMFVESVAYVPPVFPLGHNPELLSLIEDLYHTHGADLNHIKDQMREVYTSTTIRPQYDDIEGEITTLLLLFFQPKQIFEFSPSHGWSTLYMLNAIQMYQRKNRASRLLLSASESESESEERVELHSYDLEDYCSDSVSAKFPSLTDPDSSIKWTFKTGDVRDAFETDFLSADPPIDYLFIDSDHSEEFVQYYIAHLLIPMLQRVREAGSYVVVSVHDCFCDGVLTHEGAEVHNFLQLHDIPYLNLNNDKHQAEIRAIRDEVDFSKDPIHFCNHNPSIYFILA